jgi:thiaminase/transcriptional activator TenA
MSFCADARAATAPIWDAIHALPFNRELAAGTLPRAAFRHYMIQDAIYLIAYARALAAAAVKAPSTAEIEFFVDSAKGALVVERQLHADYLGKLEVDIAAIEAAGASPSCFAYTSFLTGTAQTGSYEELVAAILPCFWVYWDVGKALYRASAPGNFYQAWIDTYAGDEFGELVQRCKGIADASAARSGDQVIAAMHAAFARSCRYEWAFWDSAYRLERWPV